jgi:hypothetical protein
MVIILTPIGDGVGQPVTTFASMDWPDEAALYPRGELRVPAARGDCCAGCEVQLPFCFQTS